jgi:hypothetical protein
VAPFFPLNQPTREEDNETKTGGSTRNSISLLSDSDNDNDDDVQLVR